MNGDIAHRQLAAAGRDVRSPPDRDIGRYSRSPNQGTPQPNGTPATSGIALTTSTRNHLTPSFTASAHSVNGTPRHEVDVNGRHTLTTDQPCSYGGSDAGPSPHELLAATLASCASTMIVLYAQRKDWPLERVQVDANYDSDATPRHVEITVDLRGDLTDAQIERLMRVADTCPVKRALEAGFLIRQRLADGDAPSRNRLAAASV